MQMLNWIIDGDCLLPIDIELKLLMFLRTIDVRCSIYVDAIQLVVNIVIIVNTQYSIIMY